jgi:hypothetical protein
MDSQETRFHRHLGRLAATTVPSWADCMMRSAARAPDASIADAAAGTPAGATDSIPGCLAPTLAAPRLHSAPF